MECLIVKDIRPGLEMLQAKVLAGSIPEYLIGVHVEVTTVTDFLYIMSSLSENDLAKHAILDTGVNRIIAQ